MIAYDYLKSALLYTAGEVALTLGLRTAAQSLFSQKQDSLYQTASQAVIGSLTERVGVLAQAQLGTTTFRKFLIQQLAPSSGLKESHRIVLKTGKNFGPVSILGNEISKETTECVSGLLYAGSIYSTGLILKNNYPKLSEYLTQKGTAIGSATIFIPIKAYLAPFLPIPIKHLFS